MAHKPRACPIWVLAGIIWLAVTTTTGTNANPDLIQYKRLETQFSAQIEAAQAQMAVLTDGYPGVSIAVGVSDEIVWSQAWGYAELETETPATPDTRYALYSVAKPMTGVLAAKLVSDGTLNPNASITTYLPDLPEQYRTVTAEHLLGHTSGVRHYREASHDYARDGEWMTISSRHCDSVDQALPIFIDNPLEAQPGDEYSYSSLGYVLLSRVLEAAAGRPYADLMRDHVFLPSGARGMALHASTTRDLTTATSYVSSEEGYRAAPLIDNSCRFGGGGFVGSATDLALFGLAYANGTLLDEEAFLRVQTPILPRNGDSFTGYGFAVGAGERPGGIKFTGASHGGGALGGRSYLFVIPSHDVSVAIAGNIEGPQVHQAAFNIGYIFAGIPPKTE